ncbi:putative uncharacterized protein FLJ37770 isoform X1 [Ixodes scapularis]
MLRKAYGDDAMKKSQTFMWHKRFREGRESVNDDDRSGRPSTSQTDDSVQKVRHVLDKDRRLSVRMVADECGIPKTIVHRILTEDLQMRKVCAKMVPKVLTSEMKEERLLKCQELHERFETDPEFLDRVITGDETWIFEYDPESKRQSSEWHTTESPRPKKARMSKSRIKAMLIVFFDRKGVVHSEFVPQGQTVNKEFYCEVLKRLRNRVRRVRKEICDNWILHHDNASSHTALIVSELLAKMCVPTLPQPPYSPDLAPPDFFLFPRIKRTLKGTRHGTLETVKAAATTSLKEVPVDGFQGAFSDWVQRWQQCIEAGGDYFEKF